MKLIDALRAAVLAVAALVLMIVVAPLALLMPKDEHKQHERPPGL